MAQTNDSWIAFLLLLIIVLGGGYWYWTQSGANDPAATPVSAPPVSESESQEVDDEPAYPVSSPDLGDSRDLIELPPLSDSDAYFKLTLIDAFGQALENLLVESGGIERFVTTIDNLPRSTLSERLRPVAAVDGSLAVSQMDSETYELLPTNFERYLPYVQMLEQADTNTLLSSYRRFYPLLQEAYESLGYPNGYFNDRLIEVIDHLLATPSVELPILLKRPHVLYEFADPEIQQLSSGQKTMVRIGPDNAARVKARLAVLREGLSALD